MPGPKDPRSQRLWRVSRILNESPFSDAVQELSDAQMNWIMEMHADETPGVVLERPDEIRPEQVAIAWSKVIIDQAALLGSMVSLEAVKAATLRRQAG